MGELRKEFKAGEQVELTFDQPGKYLVHVRELNRRNKNLCVVRTNRKAKIRRTKKPKQDP
jgi:hypothetical protein